MESSKHSEKEEKIDNGDMKKLYNQAVSLEFDMAYRKVARRKEREERDEQK